jgi:hypothetical protein
MRVFNEVGNSVVYAVFTFKLNVSNTSRQTNTLGRQGNISAVNWSDEKLSPLQRFTD